MASLTPLWGLVLLADATPAHASGVADWRALIAQASDRCGIPARWIERVMQVESGGRTSLGGKPIRSRVGAIGLMQLMPGTWAAQRATLGLGPDPDDPRDNILAGSCYLRLMYDRFGYPGLFAAYNAGPTRYAGYAVAGRPLPAETRSYLRALGVDPEGSETTGWGRAPSLFAIDRGPGGDVGTPLARPRPALFLVRHEGP